LSTYFIAQHDSVTFLVEAGADGASLYTICPGLIGDTWHLGVEEAKAQAAYALGGICGPWRPVDAEFADRLKTGKTRP
jgi:hypothetical protein